MGIESLEKLSTTWRSERLGREVKLVRWGHFGQPVLLFPTAGGDAEEVERMHLVAAVAPLIEAGAIKVYSCDSVAGKALLTNEGGNAQHQMWVQDQFHRYVRHEVVPAIRMDCKSPDVEVWTAGASIGAFNAVAMVCRFPDVFARCIAMSGTYDLRRFYKAQPHEFTDEFWVSSPLHFVGHLSGPHIEMLRRRYVLLLSGEGRAEAIGESWAMANVLGRQGVPNRVESWGAEWHHDWPTWRAMLPKVLGEWTRSQP
jgi:esterase/lipase superfamily enzyme